MRGQAFIVFQSPIHANEAFKNLNKAPFFGKYMEIQWAKRDSDITLSPQELQNVKKTRRRVISKNYFQSRKFKDRMSKKMAQRSKEIQALDQVNMNILDQMLNPNTPATHQNTEEVNQSKKKKIPSQKKLNEPHSMLILEKLPKIPTDTLKLLFAGLEGYKEIRHIESKGIALIDFEDANMARIALESVESHVFEGGERIHINFAKK
jgi:hypothetical protein